MSLTDTAVFRRAAFDDINAIVDLLNKFAAQGVILPRTYREVATTVDQFIVASLADVTVGCVTLKDYGQGLFEIRSLAVSPNMQGGGIGSQLVLEAREAAQKMNASRIFALTYRPHLFEQLNFHQVKKELFPQKVWNDCSRCPKRDRCDEIAVLLKCP